jgi:hypothetical protein
MLSFARADKHRRNGSANAKNGDAGNRTFLFFFTSAPPITTS